MSDLPESIVTDAAGLADCCEHLAGVATFGFDTEFVGEDTYHPELCLVQVGTAERRFLLDPFAIGPLDGFWRAVIDPTKRVIVHAGREEIRLCNRLGGATPGHLADVQIAAGLLGLGFPLGHGPLLYQTLGVQLDKGDQLTDWRNRPLSSSQIRYAFDDVRYLIPLWSRLETDLQSLGRLEWAEEEFAGSIRRAVADNPAVEKWRKLKGISNLERKKLAVVRAIHEWRDRQADILNRPARVVLRDDLIIEIAKRAPGRGQDLSLLRGVNKGEVEGILNAIESAKALPPAEWPEAFERDNDSAQIAMATALMNAVFQDMCARMRLTPALAASMNDLRSVIRARVEGEELPEASQLTRGWRRDHLLPELLAVLDGRKTIRIVDLRSDAPLEFRDV